MIERYEKAIHLGIEALKYVGVLRRSLTIPFAPLPGETRS